MGDQKVCIRCKRPVVLNAKDYEPVFEKMHYTCFHYEFEHDPFDPDEECRAGGCPSASIHPRPERRPENHPGTPLPLQRQARSFYSLTSYPQWERLVASIEVGSVEVCVVANEKGQATVDAARPDGRMDSVPLEEFISTLQAAKQALDDRHAGTKPNPFAPK